MSPIVAAVVLQLLTSAFSANVTEDASNKTKRTVADQVQNFAESRPVLYNDAQTGLTGFYDPIKPAFEPDLSKQVAAQQVLYEFQQTPTNAVSNVHVNQYYQPLQQKEHYEGENAGPAQFAATIATPVQHGAVIRHGGPNYQQYHPAPPQHIQTHQYIPGKLFYVNGKIVYPPGQNYQKQAYNPYQKQVYYPYQQHRVVTPTYRPVMYTKFTPPQQLQKITKPMYSPEVVEEQKEEQKPAEEDENAEEVEEKEESEDKASLEEEDDDEDQHFSKYTSFDDDDDDHDHSAYRHYEDEDEDSERESSRTVPKKHSKKPQKYTKSNNYKYSENYSSSSKYDKPMKKAKKGGKSPKMHYKSVKYSKRSHAKPRIDSFEGKQSQNIPVIHKQKIFKEKWYVTKSTDDSITQ